MFDSTTTRAISAPSGWQICVQKFKNAFFDAPNVPPSLTGRGLRVISARAASLPVNCTEAKKLMHRVDTIRSEREVCLANNRRI